MRIALWVSRALYALFILYSLLYFPMMSGFRLSAPRCEWTFGPALGVHSLTNYRHIVLLCLFFLLTYAQLPGVRHRMAWSFAICMVMGLLAELGQGVSGHGHCRMRDLIPDAVGTAAGTVLVLLIRHRFARRTA
ncbi:MAG TPA: hypothetical protein VNI54_10175 [Thermoanaerobaculia bacterium]|nr:hypothetical protein [Thermoanaerobaculia bacterium]